MRNPQADIRIKVAMRSEIGTHPPMKHLLSTLLLVSLATVFCGCGGEKSREAKRQAAVEARQADEAQTTADAQADALEAQRTAEIEKHQRRQKKIEELEATFEKERPAVAKQIVVRLHAPGLMFSDHIESLSQKLVSMFEPLFPGVKVIPFDAMSAPVSQFALGEIDVNVQGSWATYGPNANPREFNGVGCVVKSIAMQVYFPPEFPIAESNGVLVVAAEDLPKELTKNQMYNLHPQRIKKLESECLSKLAAVLKPVDEKVLQEALDAAPPITPEASEGYALIFEPNPDSYARSEIIGALEKRLGRGRVFQRGYPGKTEIGTVTVNFKQLGSFYKTPGGTDAGVTIPEEAELKITVAQTGGEPQELTYKAELNAPETMHFQNMNEVAFFQMHALLQELARKMGAR